MALRLGAIVEALGGELHGDPDLLITALAPLESAVASELGFLSHPKYEKQLAASAAGCVIVGQAAREAALRRGGCIITEQPYLYFARTTQLWKKHLAPAGTVRIHPSAVVDAQAQVDPSAVIGPLCVVERGARIGAGTVLRSRVTVG